MSIPIDDHIKTSEAAALVRLLAKSGMGQAELARQAGVSRAMLHQHIRAMRPISLAMAKSYAAALDCAIADISPRWAAELGQANPLPATIPRLGNSGPLTLLHRELLDAARGLSDRGLYVLIHQARQLAADYPAQANPEKSSG